ncbi:MAG: adenylyltransferase/cytidyltransferase family protein [Halobacteria archaeon]
MTKVLATGTFDVLHPGHLHYLSSSKEEGDHLTVIIAREEMLEHKDNLLIPEEQRREMVEALEPVDEAVLGSRESIFEPLYDIEPDVVTLGHDQQYGVDELEEDLRERGLNAEVVRIEKRPESGDEILSSSSIIEKAKQRDRR